MILFAGAHYEMNITSGAISKYYFAGASRIAMRKYTIPVSMEVEYLVGDHLGSTSITTDANGAKVSEKRYKPWGETRYTWTDPSLDTTPAYTMTRYQYTGQFSYEAEFGLYFYNARWYDSQLGRFAQADTMIPAGTQGWDRYAYVNNNPVRNTDPSGNETCIDGDCNYELPPPMSEVDIMKMKIYDAFGITMSDEGKAWDLNNLKLMYASLWNINDVLAGKLGLLAKGWKFTLRKQNEADGQYHGVTHTDGSQTIDFFTVGKAAIRQMNIYHEVGHLLDNISGMKNRFMSSVSKLEDPDWVGSDKRVSSTTALRLSHLTNDPNYRSVEAVQAYNNGSAEIWADAFANHVAGNIDLNKSSGRDMRTFVTKELFFVTHSPESLSDLR